MSARWWSFILQILFVIFLNWYACTAVTYVDSTAIHALKEIYHEYKARNIQVIHHYHLQLCSLSETLDAQTQSGKWLDKFNSPHFFNLALWILLLSYVALMWSLFLMMSQPTRSYYYLDPYMWVAYGLWLRMDTKKTCYCETMCPKHINHFRFNNLDNWERPCDHLKRKGVFTLSSYFNCNSETWNDKLWDLQYTIKWDNSQYDPKPSA